MTGRTIIGLAGKARAGKDTAGQFLVDHHGFTRVAFADKLKEAAYQLDPIIQPLTYGHLNLQEVVDHYGWEKAKDEYPEIRRILQALGTEAGWKIHGHNLWVNAAATTIDALPVGTPVVITDVRFPHEVAWIRSQGGIITEIVRPFHSDSLDGDAASHDSEKVKINPDVKMLNTGTVDTLGDMISALATTLQEKMNV